MNEWLRAHRDLRVEEVNDACSFGSDGSKVPRVTSSQVKGPSCGQKWRRSRQQPAPIRPYQLMAPCSALSPKVRGTNQAQILASPTTTVFPAYAHTTGQTQFHPLRRENQTPRPRLHGLHHHPKQHILSLGTGARQDGCWQVRGHPEILPKSMP